MIFTVARDASERCFELLGVCDVVPDNYVKCPTFGEEGRTSVCDKLSTSKVIPQLACGVK